MMGKWTLRFLGQMEHFRKSPTENHQGMVCSVIVKKKKNLNDLLGQTHSAKYNLIENMPQKLFMNRT